MHPSIYQEFIACKLKADMGVAAQARAAQDATRKPRRQERFARRRRFVRRPTPTVSSR